jgi:hypothetical protein
MRPSSWHPLALLAAIGLLEQQRNRGLRGLMPRLARGHTSKIYTKFNRERECARRRRQIEHGIINVAKAGA